MRTVTYLQDAIPTVVLKIQIIKQTYLHRDSYFFLKIKKKSFVSFFEFFIELDRDMFLLSLKSRKKDRANVGCVQYLIQ